MDSQERFKKKIKTIQSDPNLDNLKLLVSDIWSWCDLYQKNDSPIQSAANDIELIIAICFDEERPLTKDEISSVQKKLDEILIDLDRFVQ